MRTVTIALIAGAIFALVRHRRTLWPFATLLMLWPSFGGHWVELWFLNWLRPRIADSRAVQVSARVMVWLIGGAVLALGMCLTATMLADVPPSRWPTWWLGGVAFIGIELVAQLALQLSGRPSFYNGRG
jgi:hypothetical protein